MIKHDLHSLPLLHDLGNISLTLEDVKLNSVLLSLIPWSLGAYRNVQWLPKCINHNSCPLRLYVSLHQALKKQEFFALTPRMKNMKRVKNEASFILNAKDAEHFGSFDIFGISSVFSI